MSIRYKTAFIFLVSGLLPFFIVGALVFIDFQNSLRSSTIRNLEAVTTLQESRIIDLLTVYAEGADYFAAQPAVRSAAQAYEQHPDAPGMKTMLLQTLQAMQTSGSDSGLTPIEAIAITDPAGKVLSATNTFPNRTTLPVQSDHLLTDVYRDPDGVHILLNAPVSVKGATVARFYMTMNAQPLLNIMAARDGLGQTGETFLVKQQDSKTGVFISPLRFDANAAFRRTVPLSDTNRPSAQALLQKEKTFTRDVMSYRGTPVIAVTRYMPQVGLGIVGQMDQIEAFVPVRDLAVQVVVFAAILSLLTLFIGSFMAELFTRPVLHLANVSSKLRKGDFSARARIWTNDEIGQLGQAFNAMASDLAKQDQAKSDIIALISHQLRTPVTAVKGFVSLVLQSKQSRLAEDDVKKLHLAFLENEKLNKLITQILEVAHADSGKLTLKTTPTDAIRLVQGVGKEFKPMLELRKQALKVTHPARPIMVTLDADKITFVLDILLSNASKYSPEDTTIELHVSRKGKQCLISVHDQGVGIRLEDQGKLFQKFSRIENPRSDTSEGAGLGLYMAKKIIDLHGGNISVSSSINHGSRFTIELPINT